MAVQLEYIMSGTSYIGLHADKEEEIYQQYSSILSNVKSNTNHKFGLLFNAFQEVRNGENINNLSGLDSIHADSGGLQMITRGMTADDNDKKAVYQTQAKLSSVGMCFDEIPVVIKAASARNDYAGRFYKDSLLESCAKTTGENVAKQIETFLELESDCKPFVIAQGNDYDSYMRWVETVMKQIPQDHHKHIGGLAMGAAALGTGYLEEVEKAFIATQLPIDTKSIHILGVGSIKRMLPMVALIRGGMFDGMHISYDSTTHSSSVEVASYMCINSRGLYETVKYGKTYSKIYDRMYDDVSKIYDHGLDKQGFMKVFSGGATLARETIGIDKFFLVKTATAVSSMIAFAKSLENCIADKQSFIDNIGKQSCLLHLEEVKSKADFDSWMRNFGRTLKSNRVARFAEDAPTLDDFFI